MGRVPVTIPVLGVHEVISEDLAEDKDARATLIARVANKELPEIYYTHPVVRATTELVFPLMCFLDGVPYSLVDGILGVWIGCLTSGKRWLVGIIRKANCCACGCRGWCTFYELFSYLHWVFLSLANKEHPRERHDGTPHVEERRQGLAGLALRARCCCLYLNVDWMEIATSLGMQSSQDGIRPCYTCNARKDNMFDLENCQEDNDGGFDEKH